MLVSRTLLMSSFTGDNTNMNLMNIAKHLLYLTQREVGYANCVPSADEIFVSQQLLEVLKAFKDSYFSEPHTWETLEFDDEYDEKTAEESTYVKVIQGKIRF